MTEPPSYTEILSINKEYEKKYRELFPNSKIFNEPCITPFEPLPYYNPNETICESSISILVHKYEENEDESRRHFEMNLYVLCPYCDQFKPIDSKSTKLEINEGEIIELDEKEPIFYNLLNYDYEFHIFDQHGINIHSSYLPIKKSKNLISRFNELDLTNNEDNRNAARDDFFRQLGLAYSSKINFNEKIKKNKNKINKVKTKKHKETKTKPLNDEEINEILNITKLINQ